MSAAEIRSASEFEAELRRYSFERSEESRAVRVGEKDVSEQAAIVARYAHLFSAGQIEALRTEEDAAPGRRARAPLPAAQDVRGRPDLGAAGRAGRRPRERDPRHRASSSAARRSRCAPRRRGSPCSRPTATARSSASSSATASARAQPGPPGADRGVGGSRRRDLGRARPGGAERGGEGDLAAEPRAGARRRRRRDRGRVRAPPRPLVRAAARPGSRRAADERAHRVHAPPLAARGDLHAGARR